MLHDSKILLSFDWRLSYSPTTTKSSMAFIKTQNICPCPYRSDHTHKRNLDKIKAQKNMPPHPLFQKNVPFALPGSIGSVPFIRHPVWTELVRIDLIHPSTWHNEFSNLYCVQALPSKACPSTWDSFTLLCLRVRCIFPFAKLRGGDALHFSSSVS